MHICTQSNTIFFVCVLFFIIHIISTVFTSLKILPKSLHPILSYGYITFFQTLSYYCTCYIQGLQKHIKTLCRLAKVIPFSNYELVFYCTTWTTTQGSCARVGVQEPQQATDLAVHTCIPAHEPCSCVLTKITPGHQGTNMPKPVPDTPAPNFSEETTTLVPVRGGGRGREVGVWESSPKRAGKWTNNLRGCLELNPDKTLLYTPVWPEYEHSWVQTRHRCCCASTHQATAAPKCGQKALIPKPTHDLRSDISVLCLIYTCGPFVQRTMWIIILARTNTNLCWNKFKLRYVEVLIPNAKLLYKGVFQSILSSEPCILDRSFIV